MMVIFLFLLFLFKYSNALPTPDDTSRIYGGIPVTTVYPWLAVYYFLDTSGKTYQCAGSFIASNIILTAAHCLVNAQGFALILSGDDNIEQRDGIVWNAIAWKTHELYNPQTFENDIALILVSERIAFSSTPMVPIQMGTVGYNLDTGICTVLGWGLTSNLANATTTPILNQAHLDLISESDCSTTWSSLDINSVITTNQICAMDVNQGRDTCKGDSGGPLLITDSNSNIVLEGITSWGSSVCGNGSPGIYTKVSAYSDWIQANINLIIQNNPISSSSSSTSTSSSSSTSSSPFSKFTSSSTSESSSTSTSTSTSSSFSLSSTTPSDMTISSSESTSFSISTLSSDSTSSSTLESSSSSTSYSSSMTYPSSTIVYFDPCSPQAHPTSDAAVGSWKAASSNGGQGRVLGIECSNCLSSTLSGSFSWNGTADSLFLRNVNNVISSIYTIPKQASWDAADHYLPNGVDPSVFHGSVHCHNCYYLMMKPRHL